MSLHVDARSRFILDITCSDRVKCEKLSDCAYILPITSHSGIKDNSTNRLQKQSSDDNEVNSQR